MASKALNQMIFDAHWGEIDFMLLDLPPGTGDIHLSIMQAMPVTGAVVVSTPQNIALADAKKGVAMFQQENINVPVLGIIENMAYFTPEELPDNKYYIFGKDGAKHLAQEYEHQAQSRHRRAADVYSRPGLTLLIFVRSDEWNILQRRSSETIRRTRYQISYGQFLNACQTIIPRFSNRTRTFCA